jgi:hypothetical protein
MHNSTSNTLIRLVLNCEFCDIATLSVELAGRINTWPNTLRRKNAQPQINIIGTNAQH